MKRINDDSNYEHDNKGHFAKGSRGPGRPTKEYEEKWHRILCTTVHEEDWAGIVKKAVRQALIGNAAARKWLSDNLMGLPVQRQIIETMPGNEGIVMVPLRLAAMGPLEKSMSTPRKSAKKKVTPKKRVVKKKR